MKKQAVFMVALSSLVLLSGCNGSARLKSEKEAMQHEIDSLKGLLGTYKSKYGELAILDVANKQFGIWKIGYYVDDFGERTGESYVHTETLGVFSNSATTNSNLGVSIIVNKSRIIIQFYEYARNHLTKDTGFLSFKAKRSDGKTMEFETLNEQGNNIVYGDKKLQDNPKTVQELIDFLDAGGEVMFVAKNSNSEYKFKLTDTSYLRKALESL